MDSSSRLSPANRGLANLLCRILFCGLFFAVALTAQPPHEQGPALGKPAPALVRTGLDGQPVDLAKLRGKVVLLNFWATWCAPCQAEMPIFVRWQSAYQAQGLQVVGVSMDDDAGPVQRLTRRLHVNYPVAMGDEKLGAAWGNVLGLPLTFVIDRKGIVRARFAGETDPAKILAALKPLLAER